mmetsp:Transcript_25223/g.56009  ORF Transcript_25223/g.56009 Transcript_25223/m.56009 type:complete len:121 (-) Transcript_25223:49-411(-)
MRFSAHCYTGMANVKIDCPHAPSIDVLREGDGTLMDWWIDSGRFSEEELVSLNRVRKTETRKERKPRCRERKPRQGAFFSEPEILKGSQLARSPSYPPVNATRRIVASIITSLRMGGFRF